MKAEVDHEGERNEHEGGDAEHLRGNEQLAGEGVPLAALVATAKVRAPMTKTRVLGILETTSTGSVMASPNTVREPDVTMTMTSEKAKKLTGSPQKLPTLTIRSDGEKRAKSQKLSISVEKYATTREAAVRNATMAAPVESSLSLKLKPMFPRASIMIQMASANMAT